MAEKKKKPPAHTSMKYLKVFGKHANIDKMILIIIIIIIIFYR